MQIKLLVFITFCFSVLGIKGQSTLDKTEENIELTSQIESLALKYEQDMIAWRRHFHQHPELSNREYQTMRFIYHTLKSWDVVVDTGMAHTGVVAVLDTGKPGPVVGLRADMDALPIEERVDLPFASKVKTEYIGQTVGVMHACGHDAHMAILMGTMRVLLDVKENLKGKIVFVFQPAEEGTPPGEEGGAALLIKEGLMEKYGIEVIYGLHMSSTVDVGKITYKPGSIMAAADIFSIKVK
jgi:amidohydrolase